LFVIFSQTGIGPTIESWGLRQALSAIADYLLGCISYGVFTALLIFDGNVPDSVKSRKRIMTEMTVHSIFGFAQYLNYCEKIS